MFWERLFASIDRFMQTVRDFFGITPTSCCSLHTVDETGEEEREGGGCEAGILVADTSAMVSLVEVHGSLRLVGAEEFENLCSALTRCLHTPLSRTAHALQVHFTCDPAGAGPELARALRPLHVTADNLGLDLHHVLTDWEKTLACYCAHERTLLAFWTMPGILSQAEYKKALAENRAQPAPRLELREAQWESGTLSRMRDLHKAQVRALCETLVSQHLKIRPLGAHEAVRCIRAANLPHATAPVWRCVLPGDPLPVRLPKAGTFPGDVSSFLPPTLARQIWPVEARIHEGQVVEVDNRLHAPLFLSLPPQTLLPFASLFRSLLSENLPWRASFLLTGDGLSGQSLKAVAASILSFAAPTNRMLQQSFRHLQDMALQGTVCTGLQASFDTWVDLVDEEVHPAPGGSVREEALRLALRRQARLSSAVQAWGACDTARVCGDVLQLYAATLPAQRPSQPVPRAIAPLQDAVRLLPLFRPCSPWTDTDVPLRTPDGRLMPVGLFHSSMASWNEICFAGMGAGKSFFLNTLNFFYILRAGQTRLPWLTIIDIGPSCSGVIELVRASLPASQRHLAVFARLRNVREAAINPFDTLLGCPYPLPNHAQFLVNLLALLCTPVSETAPADGVTDLLREALDAVYRRLAPDGSTPRRFDPWPQPAITNWLAAHGRTAGAGTTWWEVVDLLFAAGEIPLALQAQRQAVPTLADILVEFNDPLLRTRFGGITLQGSAESVPEACVRHLTTALREYPLLSSATKFDLGAARIVGLDLSEVTPRGGPAAERQSGIMYLLARFVGAGRFFNTLADLDRIPEPYKSWHRPQFENLAADPKRLCYDEFHRASCADMNNPLSRQILADLTTASREARKQNLSIGLYSQQLEDFPKVLVDLATSIYVLGAGNARQAQEIGERFGLNEAARLALRTITRPTRAGANFVAVFRTASGESIQHLTCTAGSYARWAFTTTAEDMQIRNRLYVRLGCAEALECLRDRYPGGSIKEEAERRRLEMEARLGEKAGDVLEEIVEELEAYARTRKTGG